MFYDYTDDNVLKGFVMSIKISIFLGGFNAKYMFIKYIQNIYV